MPNPRILRRALLGLLTPPVAILDDVPEDRRPARRTVFRPAAFGPAPHPGPRSVAQRLVLLSYNLQRTYREAAVLASLSDAVAEHAPDLLLLQEVPRDLWCHPRLAAIFDPLDLFYAPFHQLDRPRGAFHHPEYGQLTASRFPLHNPQVLELPTVTRAGLGRGHVLKRIALLTELPMADGRVLRLAHVHHEPFVWPRGRTPQHTAVLERLPRRDEAVDLCVGDFNASRGVLREPGLEPWWRQGFEAALPAAGRRDNVDNALVRGHRKLEARRLRRSGSDHPPVLVRVEL